MVTQTGQTQEDFSPADGIYQASYPVAITVDGGQLVASFPGATEGWLVFDAFLSFQYGGNGLNFTIVWMCTGNVGTVKFGVSLYRMNNGLVYTTPAWGTEVSSTVTVPGVAFQLVYTTLTISSPGIQPGELYQIRLRRDVTPAQNSSSAAEVVGMRVVEV